MCIHFIPCKGISNSTQKIILKVWFCNLSNKYWKGKKNPSPTVFNKLLLKRKVCPLEIFLSPLVPHQRRHHCHQQPPCSWPSPAPNSHPEPQKRNLHCLLYLPLFSDLKIVIEDPIPVNLPNGGGYCPHAWLYLVFSDLKIVAGGLIPPNLQAAAVEATECRTKMGALGVHVSLCVDASVFPITVDWELG